MPSLLLAMLLLIPLTTHAQQAPAHSEAPWYQWRPLTGCTPGKPDALERDLTAKGIKFETESDGVDVSWVDPKDGQDEVASFFHDMNACVTFSRTDDAAWFAYAGEPFGCVEVIPTQQQIVEFHKKKDGRAIARSYEDGNVIIIRSSRPGSKLHIVNIRGKKFCEMLGPIYGNAPDTDLAIMKSRKL